jgi:hypothetical protein
MAVSDTAHASGNQPDTRRSRPQIFPVVGKSGSWHPMQLSSPIRCPCDPPIAAFEFLDTTGTTHAQGYYFSKAVDVAHAEELLRQGSVKPMTEQGELALVTALLTGKAR